jgi:hypothetical protein
MYKLGPIQGTTKMGIIYMGPYVRHFLQNFHNNTRVFPLWPNFLWNLERAQEFPLWWHFLWNLHKNMSFFFYDPIFYGTYTQQKSFHYDGIFFWTYAKTWVSSSMTQFLWNLHKKMSFFFYDPILYGTYIAQEFPFMPHFLWNLHNTICLTIFEDSILSFANYLFIYKISRFLKIILLMLKLPR